MMTIEERLHNVLARERTRREFAEEAFRTATRQLRKIEDDNWRLTVQCEALTAEVREARRLYQKSLHDIEFEVGIAAVLKEKTRKDREQLEYLVRAAEEKARNADWHYRNLLERFEDNKRRELSDNRRQEATRYGETETLFLVPVLQRSNLTREEILHRVECEATQVLVESEEQLERIKAIFDGAEWGQFLKSETPAD